MNVFAREFTLRRYIKVCCVNWGKCGEKLAKAVFYIDDKQVSYVLEGNFMIFSSFVRMLFSTSIVGYLFIYMVLFSQYLHALYSNSITSCDRTLALCQCSGERSQASSHLTIFVCVCLRSQSDMSKECIPTLQMFYIYSSRTHAHCVVCVFCHSCHRPRLTALTSVSSWKTSSRSSPSRREGTSTSRSTWPMPPTCLSPMSLPSSTLVSFVCSFVRILYRGCTYVRPAVTC